MKTISGLGIGLSLVCGFLLLALVAEVYYLLRWKKKIISQESEEEKEEEKHVGYGKELIQLLCFKQPQSLHANNGGREEEVSRNQDLELGLMKHLGGGDLGFEAELMKLHNQRLLFTIIEETKADLESDDGESRSRTRSLSDIQLGVNDCNTPGSTPLASPLECYSSHGLNPLFETEGELEFNKFFRSASSSSPPPKFKFLRDAEEKLRRRLMEEAKIREQKVAVTEGSFMKFMNPSMMNRGEKQSNQESLSPSSGTNLGMLDQRSTLVV
ncbi:unnamed protein product [Eruca vesicaria subsp. sativa]|uniref:Transmembrane protein n=1 Tax=Eruca vesicaria subsp. sativa TaxID=29727 RepID=A0ABC8J544_ERUVS|nr:unnamed protein product [Eruca vesicaria subsp. sativa]